MGSDKALLKLRGTPLIEHTVRKLSRVCERVSILASTPELASYGPLVHDIHPGCGPIGGIEAALQTAVYDWSLTLPVDVPFVPTPLLARWADVTIQHGIELGTRLSMWTVEGKPQPALSMVHRDLLPFVQAAIGRGEFKLLPVLQQGAARSGEHIAEPSGAAAASRAQTFWAAEDVSTAGPTQQAWDAMTREQRRSRTMWFANLNTPDEFAAAEQHSAALDA